MKEKCHCIREQGYLKLCEPCRLKAVEEVNKMKLGTDIDPYHEEHQKKFGPFSPYCRTCTDESLKKLSKEDLKFFKKE